MFTQFSRKAAKSRHTTFGPLGIQAPRRAVPALCFSSKDSVPPQPEAEKKNLFQTSTFSTKEEGSSGKSNSENQKKRFFNNENYKGIIGLLTGGAAGALISAFFNTQISKRAAKEKIVEELRQDFKDRQKSTKILLKRAIRNIEEFQSSYVMTQTTEAFKTQDIQDLLYDLNLALIDNDELLKFIDFVQTETIEKIKANNDWETEHYLAYFNFFKNELENQRELLNIAKNLHSAILCFKDTNYAGAQHWLNSLRTLGKTKPEFINLDFKQIKYTSDQRKTILDALLKDKFQNFELKRPKLHHLSLNTFNKLKNDDFCIPKFRSFAYHLNGMILNESNYQEKASIRTEVLDDLLYALTENPGNSCLWINLEAVLKNIPSLEGYASQFSAEALKLSSRSGTDSP